MRHTKVRVHYTSPIRPLPLPFSPPSTLPPLHSVPAPLPSLLQSGPQTQLWDLGERYELPQRYILEPKSRVWWRLKNPIRRLDSVPTVPPPRNFCTLCAWGHDAPDSKERAKKGERHAEVLPCHHAASFKDDPRSITVSEKFCSTVVT